MTGIETQMKNCVPSFLLVRDLKQNESGLVKIISNIFSNDLRKLFFLNPTNC